MYDVTEKCPICTDKTVILSKNGDRLMCTCCENWISVDDAVGSGWVRERKVRSEEQ